MVDFWMIDGVWLGVFVFIGDGVFFFFFILEIIWLFFCLFFLWLFFLLIVFLIWFLLDFMGRFRKMVMFVEWLLKWLNIEVRIVW